jgi:hypothetical protein
MTTEANLLLFMNDLFKFILPLKLITMMLRKNGDATASRKLDILNRSNFSTTQLQTHYNVRRASSIPNNGCE